MASYPTANLTINATFDPAVEHGVDYQLREHLAHKKAQAALKAKVKLVEAYGDDVYSNGTVIRFSKVFPGDTQRDLPPKLYEYAALKTSNKWYLTGSRSPQGISYDELVLFLVSGNNPVSSTEVTVIT